MNKFYVYVYLNPFKKINYSTTKMSFLYEPIYVGKGHLGRSSVHIREVISWNHTKKYLKYNVIKKIIDKGELPYILYYKENLNEEDALTEEYKLINELGLRIERAGPLTNIRKCKFGINEKNKKQLKKRDFKKREKRITVILNGEITQLTEEAINSLNSSLYYYRDEKPQRYFPRKNKQRLGKENGRYGSISSSKGKKWIKMNNGDCYLLSLEEINLLDNKDYTFGRNLPSQKNRLRIIYKNEQYGQYVSKDMSDVKINVEFQYGVTWKHTKKTYIKGENNVISKN